MCHYIYQTVWESATEVEETIKRIQAHKGVMGVVIVNHEGIPIKSSLDNATSVLYSGLIGQLTEKARNVVREMDSTNELTFLRVRSRRHEILIAPDREFILIVIQNTTD
ncbi:robl [Danaus plexippus plexippus]|uniref:Dynein light chain roadblock n=1 Tax=Danaus plexippus plexippus TaxID=278856 RepID=A0A212FKB7_DANPL|nr:robl [Danaus plexippus plexippus]